MGDPGRVDRLLFSSSLGARLRPASWDSVLLEAHRLFVRRIRGRSPALLPSLESADEKGGGRGVERLDSVPHLNAGVLYSDFTCGELLHQAIRLAFHLRKTSTKIRSRRRLNTPTKE